MRSIMRIVFTFIPPIYIFMLIYDATTIQLVNNFMCIYLVKQYNTIWK